MNTAINKQVGLSDRAIEAFFSFFTWSFIGLAKSLSNHPDIRQDRWIILSVSLVGVGTLVLTVFFFCLTITEGYSWWWVAAPTLTTIAYSILTVVQSALDVPAPADTYRGFD